MPFPISDVDFATEEEAITHAWSLNRDRRHATPTELAISGAEMVALLGAIAKKRQEKGTLVPDGTKGKAAEKAAEIVGTSTRQVQRAVKIKKDGSPAVKQAVADRTITLNDAATVAAEPIAVQEAAVAAVRAGEAKTATQSVATLDTAPVIRRRRIGSDRFRATSMRK